MHETAATEITPHSGRRPQEIWPLAPLCRNHGVGTLDRELIRSCRDGDVVTQLTFTILMQSFDKLQREDRLGSWLATVARRHTWRLLDSKRREGPSRDEALAGRVALLGKSDADHLERWELVEWLNDGLSLLDERCRDLLLALYFDPEQPSYAEISTRSGMPVGSIGPTRVRKDGGVTPVRSSMEPHPSLLRRAHRVPSGIRRCED